MTSTGAKYPTAGSSVSESPYDHLTWQDPTNIYADDGSYAYIDDNAFDSGVESYILKAQGFDFSSVPEAANITGVTCKIEAYYSVGASGIAMAQLLDMDGARTGTNLAETPIELSTTPTIETIGAANNLWGNELSVSWVQDADFGVGIGVIPTGNNANVYIDYITLAVDYTVEGETVPSIYYSTLLTGGL